jgi:membrane associated rhomboid family serine protease
MIPLRDNIPSRQAPLVNYAIIAVTAVVFLMQLARPDDAPSLVEQYGMIPARVQDPDAQVMVPDVEDRDGRQVRIERPAADPAIPAWLTLLTCVFLHGGWLHFLGNMWFLYIFGDNVEDCYGHLGYLAFYLAAGVAASVTHLATNLGSPIPTIGASGAIAGVMGAYFLLYPHARVLAIVPLFVVFFTMVVPASVFLGIWFLIQFWQGAATIQDVSAEGVAWWAHIGGFVAGAAATYVLRKAGLLRETVHVRLPNTDHSGVYRTGSRGGPRSADPFEDDPLFRRRG